jgi:hypothetical protein
MKVAFHVCWAIWWIGAAVGHFGHWPRVQAIATDVFGPLTIVLGLVWAGRWVWRKARKARRSRAAD